MVPESCDPGLTGFRILKFRSSSLFRFKRTWRLSCSLFDLKKYSVMKQTQKADYHRLQLHFHVKQPHFHIKGFARRIALKENRGQNNSKMA